MLLYFVSIKSINEVSITFFSQTFVLINLLFKINFFYLFYQLLYYDKLFNGDIFITENEENNLSYISLKDVNENNLEIKNVNKSLENNKGL